MGTPTEIWNLIKNKIKIEWKVAFLTTFCLGILIHMPMLLSDIPNHDGLASMYFDQNMITSGRWFLTIACGFSSYYTLPWLIGVISIFFLSLTSVALIEFLEIHNKGIVVSMSALLISFPALASNFAYVFTMDGYMLALLLAVLSVVITKKYSLGFVGGGFCLALSLGIYQAYLPFAVILSIYGILMICMKNQGGKTTVISKIKASLKYLYMGILGLGLYWIILNILLKIQGKTLSDYQGINSMGTVEKAGLFDIIKNIYADFIAFSLNGNVLFQNLFSAIAILLLLLFTIITLFTLCKKRKWWKQIWFYIIIILLVVGLPIATNVILIISPNVEYHLLMRYQWVLYPILMIAFVSHYGTDRRGTIAWGLLICTSVMILHYVVVDNIAYSNLHKKYEKTYAYCVRLLDRIEQTPGYYQGIPIAMVGVVGENEFPMTDITLPATSNMIGTYGDSLLYTGANYQEFMKHYLGATLNILPAEVMGDIYFSREYRAMESFPGATSIQVVNDIMYIKTENME